MILASEFFDTSAKKRAIFDRIIIYRYYLV